MGGKCTKCDETDNHNDVLEVIPKIVKDNRPTDAHVDLVKGVWTYTQDDVEVTILSQVVSPVILKATFGSRSSAVKPLNKSKETDVHAKEGLAFNVTSFIRHHQLFPGLTSVVCCWSDKQNCPAFEDLCSFKSLKKQLASGKFEMSTIRKVADAIAQMHKATNANSHPDLFKELAQEFQDSPSIHSLNDLFKVNVESLEAGPFKDAVKRLQTSSDVQAAIASSVEVAKNKKQALLHGRLIGESILTKGDHIKLTSGHCLFVGPCALDVGFLLAEYLYTYHDHMLTPENNDWHRKISYQMIDAANETMQRYLAVMGEYLKDGQDEFFSDVAAFCGVQLVNRALNSAQKVKVSKSLTFLESGERLLDTYNRIHDAGFLVYIAFALYC